MKTITVDELWEKDYLLKEIVGQRRWYTTYRYIFEEDGKLWEVLFDQGSTECQDSEEGPLDCYEVVPVEVVVTKYKRVNE